ncbi:MAG: GCN5-related N-acetyltransferase [Bacteroidetes bacterium]|nr:GCN5-related N-acetyltransferase [Bacteroidota bacterium]
MQVIQFNKNSFQKYKNQLVDLYLHAFTTGNYAQFIERKDAELGLDSLSQHGDGFIAILDKTIIGIIIGTPLSFDENFPSGLLPEIDKKSCVYIAELMIVSNMRGKGIAQKLIDIYFNKKIKEQFSDVVIRVWNENIPALLLYKKLGFIEIAEITQTKMKSQHESFEMKKLYLHKYLSNDDRFNYKNN